MNRIFCLIKVIIIIVVVVVVLLVIVAEPWACYSYPYKSTTNIITEKQHISLDK